MKTISPFFLYLLLTTCLSAQKTDSLLRALRNTPEDTSKVNSLIAYALHIQFDSTERALAYLGQAEALAKKLGDRDATGRVLYNRGSINFEGGNYPEAAADFRNVAGLFAGSDRYKMLSDAYQGIGKAYSMQDDPETALSNFQQAEQYALKLNDPAAMFSLYVNMAALNVDLIKYDDQLAYSQKAVATAQQIGHPRQLSIARASEASALLNLKRYPEAENASREALKYVARTDNVQLRTLIYANLGRIFMMAGKYADADTAYQRAAVMAEKISPYVHAQVLGGYAKLYWLRNDREKSKALYHKVLGIALERNLTATQMQCYFDLSNIEYELGNYKTAFEYGKQSRILQDSIAGQEIQNTVKRLEVRYESEKKEAAIRELENRNNIQALTLKHRNIMIYSAFAGIAALLLLLWFVRRNNRQKQQLQREKIERLEGERKIVALNAHLEGQQRERLRIAEDLHDEFGSGLSKISLLSELLKRKSGASFSEPDKIAATSKELLLKMGEIVWALNHNNDTLPSLVAYVRRYAVGFFEDTGLRCHFDVPDRIPELPLSGEVRRNIFLVIKEALNNILKHAEADKVSIAFLLTGDSLEVEIRDNGKGLPPDAREKAGNGLRNMENRMRAAGGSIRLGGGPGKGTVITISLPVAVEGAVSVQAA